jgi:hypothetical protein
MEVTYELAQMDFYESFIAHRDRFRLVKWSARLLVFFMFLVVGVGLLGVVVTLPAQNVSLAE